MKRLRRDILGHEDGPFILVTSIIISLLAIDFGVSQNLGSVESSTSGLLNIVIALNLVGLAILYGMLRVKGNREVAAQ